MAVGKAFNTPATPFPPVCDVEKAILPSQLATRFKCGGVFCQVPGVANMQHGPPLPQQHPESPETLSLGRATMFPLVTPSEGRHLAFLRPHWSLL